MTDGSTRRIPRRARTGARTRVTSSLCALALLLSASPLDAAVRGKLVAAGFSRPLLVTSPPGDPDRVLVVEQTGKVRLLSDVGPATTFLDLTSKVVCCGEQGLLGLAFHPAYARNGRLFVSYTDRSGDSVVAEYARAAGGDAADPASERILLRQDQPFANHNGGHLAFSPLDGFLYLGLGDGGSGGDPQNNAQSDTTWLGKLLRLDVDRQDPGKAYAVPLDNPWAGEAGPRAEAWAKGLRNPWRFAFDRLAGDLLIGDVGQGTWEEVDFQPASSTGGENYGWRRMEGAHCYDPIVNCQAGLPLVLPVLEYRHERGRCSVTGGVVVRDPELPELAGRYLYADYCTGEVWALRMLGGAATELTDLTPVIAPGGARPVKNPSSFGEDGLGRVYLCDHAEGEVWRLESDAPSVTRTVPIVLDVAGKNGSRFASDLTLANAGTSQVRVTLAYTAASSLGASGSGSVTETLLAGEQKTIRDAIGWLRGRGLAIPDGGSGQGGSLRASFPGLASTRDVTVAARTTTPSGPGRAGLAYGSQRDDEAFVEEALVFGLRETSADRSNLAIVNAGGEAATFRVTLRSGLAGDSRTWVLPGDLVLGPGEWRQVDSPLASAGFGQGTALVKRLSGPGPFLVYATVVDNATNDGSFLEAVRPAAPRGEKLVPVAVETPRYETELVLHNPGPAEATVTLTYVESRAFAGLPVSITQTLASGEQRIVPRLLDVFRTRGAPIGAKGGSYSGALRARFEAGGRPSAGFAAVRVAAAATGGGGYGVFLAGVDAAATAGEEAWLFGLLQDGSSRTNLALVNADPSEAVTLVADVFAAATGKKAGETDPVVLPPGGWRQLDGLLLEWGVPRGYARVRKVSGAGRFLAYAVVNDGASPGAGTDDGSAISMQSVR